VTLDPKMAAKQDPELFLPRETFLDGRDRFEFGQAVELSREEAERLAGLGFGVLALKETQVAGERPRGLYCSGCGTALRLSRELKDETQHLCEEGTLEWLLRVTKGDRRKSRDRRQEDRRVAERRKGDRRNG
jgi:hypothetical protein